MTAVGILIASTALESAASSGLTALPHETGGILLGFRTPDLVVVTRTLTVPDPRSSPHSYRRHRRRAQAKMAAAGTKTTPAIGYVGEWHTHPADCPPSRTDIRALAATARLSTAPVAMIVFAYRSDGALRTYGLTAAVGGICPVPAINPVDMFTVEPTFTNDTAASLEAEASEALITHRRLVD